VIYLAVFRIGNSTQVGALVDDPEQTIAETHTVVGFEKSRQ
jgi:hypothetical protein